MITNNSGLYNENNIHPGFSIDCVIFSFYKGKLRVLLREFALDGYWALLGGFMFNNEDADSAASRVLEYYTGLRDIYLKQFYLFSDPNRTVMEQNERFVALTANSNDDRKWLLRRFISMGYYSLIKYDRVVLYDKDDIVMKWFDVNNLPPLYTDHENIVKTALSTIQETLSLIPIGSELLPEKFTISELRKLYEIFLGKKLDRRNFQKKVLAKGHVVQLSETKIGKTYNPPILYSFKSPDKDISIHF